MGQKVPTFKLEKSPGGLAAMGWNASAYIKWGGQTCGMISAPHHLYSKGDYTYKVRLMVADGDSWRWVQLKNRFQDMSTAKSWVKEKWPAIAEKFSLHFLPDWPAE